MSTVWTEFVYKVYLSIPTICWVAAAGFDDLGWLPFPFNQVFSFENNRRCDNNQQTLVTYSGENNILPFWEFQTKLLPWLNLIWMSNSKSNLHSFSGCFHMSLRQPRTIHVFADNRIGWLWYALRICNSYTCTAIFWSSYLYDKLFELDIEIVLNYCTMPSCRRGAVAKVNLFKHSIRDICFERLDDVFVLLISLILLCPQKIFISVRRPSKL